MQTYRVTCRAAAVGVLGLLWVVTAAFTCPEICDCISDGWVYCDRQGLTDVPANIPSDTARLFLRYNTIQSLSHADFSNLTSLERLYLTNNNISSLPAGVFSHLTRLLTLYLSYNHIADLPDGVFSHLTSLERLYLTNNDISSLPAGVFSHLTRLEWLYLSYNHIADLPDGVFSNLTSLVWLYLTNNDISSLPAGVFSHLTRLGRLYLSDNHIADLPDGVFSNLTSLEYLYLSNNNISSLPADIKHLSTQTSLYITWNPWRCDCSLHDIMTSVRGSIRGNPTCSSPPHMKDNALTDVVSGRICNRRGVCTTGSTEGTCACDVRWTGPYCGEEANVVLGKNATQSSTNGSLGAEKAVDGDDTECAETNTEHQPWWKVDLAGFYRVSRVSILSRYAGNDKWRDDGRCGGSYTTADGSTAECNPNSTNPCCSPYYWCGNSADHCDCENCVNYRNVRVTVRVGLNEDVTQNDQCGQTFSLIHGQTREVECNPPMLGRYVSIQNMAERNSLSLCEVKVYVSDICCNPTIRLLNGHITATDGYCSGNKIQFSCHPGYELVGLPSATCQRDGNWEREIPTCQHSCCDHTIGLPNGQITPIDGGYCSGNNIQFSCHSGYELVGKSNATCQRDGNWDREIPTCQRTCCDNTTRIKNGQIRVDNDYCNGNSIQFSCDTGYELVGSPFAFCQNKIWDREIPTCQRICCDNTTDIMNGRVNATDGYCSGNDIQFSCNPGYELVGRSDATCQEDGNWNPDIPTCQLPTEESRTSTVPTEESRTSTEAIIGGTSAGIAALLIVAAVVFTVYLRRRRKKRKEEDYELSTVYFVPDDVIIHRRRLEEMVPLVPARPQFPKLETDPGRVTLGEKIGSGAFGIVYRATLTRDERTEDVVVKTLKENASEDDKLGFLEEIRAVVDLGVHKNLLGLLGCCTVVRDHLYLITEFMPYGDLKSFLRKCREEATSDEPGDDIYTFEVIQMYQVARQIARGMDHIARSRYVHGDLAARNVLVGKRLHVKISDFGLAEDIYSRGYRRQDRLQRVPWKWMAPERLEDGKAYTTQSDVWSFGIVLYEICTLGGDPYPGVAVSELKDRLQAGFRMDQPEDCPRAMYDLMQQCWRWQPIQRPLFSQLYVTLDKHLAFYGPEYLLN